MFVCVWRWFSPGSNSELQLIMRIMEWSTWNSLTRFATCLSSSELSCGVLGCSPNCSQLCSDRLRAKPAGFLLQGHHLPQDHPPVHAAGRRLWEVWRNRGSVDLRTPVWGRELFDQARITRTPLHGQLRAKHQWSPVLHHHRQDSLAGRQACGFRTRWRPGEL